MEYQAIVCNLVGKLYSNVIEYCMLLQLAYSGTGSLAIIYAFVLGNLLIKALLLSYAII